ncbi:hypothetical protein N9746_01755 [Candidatus Thioglobus sp.]|nr:hypothetical protein [Candidatus Thioglobus sp.]
MSWIKNKFFKNIHFYLITLLFSVVLTLVFAEITARVLWPTTWGIPAFAVPDPQRFYVLAKNYKGWWQDQPVQTNNFRMRDNRDYKVEKEANTFRILLLGDSVTFGDGNRLEETWPYQLENMLKSWEPNVDWQVWNAGVPGYDAVTELRTLKAIGPIYNPDLVIIGTYENDVMARNFDYRENAKATWLYELRSFLVKNSYLYHQLKRALNVAAESNRKAIIGKFIFSAFGDREREQRLLGPGYTMPVDVSKFELKHETVNRKSAAIPESEYHPSKNGILDLPPTDTRYKDFEKANVELQNFHKSGRWDILFFINIAPDISSDGKEFVNGIHNGMNQYFLDLLGKDGVPVVSSYDAFWSYSPTEVPGAGGHSSATANKVKASILLDHLKNKFKQSGECIIGNISCSE